MPALVNCEEYVDEKGTSVCDKCMSNYFIELQETVFKCVKYL